MQFSFVNHSLFIVVARLGLNSENLNSGRENLEMNEYEKIGVEPFQL